MRQSLRGEVQSFVGDYIGQETTNLQNTFALQPGRFGVYIR